MVSNSRATARENRGLKEKMTNEEVLMFFNKRSVLKQFSVGNIIRLGIFSDTNVFSVVLQMEKLQAHLPAAGEQIWQLYN